MTIQLRKSIETDLEVFFINQCDEEANHMAAFTPLDPWNKNAFMKKWLRLLNDNTINLQSILLDNTVIGCVIKFIIDDRAEITYAIDRQYWRKGYTTLAVKEFLKLEKSRPLFARVAFDNYASQRVLQKAGFTRMGKEKGFANARNIEIEEFVF
ncbi:MAG: GNAT family N-acetyltransferase, partial [Bacteroidales bacterium]|nr:GNAT family N-acetyltransferase [Bacteroidales bacterium]